MTKYAPSKYSGSMESKSKIDEFLNVDGPGGFQADLRQFVVGHGHVFAVLELVTANEILAFHLAQIRIEGFHLDPVACLRVDEMEGDRVRSGCRVE